MLGGEGDGYVLAFHFFYFLAVVLLGVVRVFGCWFVGFLFEGWSTFWMSKRCFVLDGSWLCSDWFLLRGDG